MLLKKILSKLSIAAICAFFLAGCSANSNSNIGVNTTTTTPTPSSSVTEIPTNTPSAAAATPTAPALSPTLTPTNKNNSENILLLKIKTSANAGKVINCDYPVNTTNIENVIKVWGKPDKTERVSAAKGTYSTYSYKNIVFGYNKGEQIFEVRSFYKDLGKLSLSMIKSTFGEPQYKVTTGGEEIIGYIINSDYKILFVFPEAKNGSTNPLLDHYSVLYPKATANSMAGDKGREW